VRAVKVPANAARVALQLLEERQGFLYSDAAEHFRAALKPRPVSSARRKTAQKKRTRKEETARIREAVFARSLGLCEFHCGREPTDLHHAFGRVRVRQSERNCLAVCRECHRALTDNKPTAAHWWAYVAFAFRRLGFNAEEAKARARLEAIEISRGVTP
jgi:hypothetical protein